MLPINIGLQQLKKHRSADSNSCTLPLKPLMFSENCEEDDDDLPEAPTMTVNYQVSKRDPLINPCLFVGVWKLLLNIWDHIAMVTTFLEVVLWPMCCQTGMSCYRHSTWPPPPITVNRSRADLSLCYPLMWNVTLEYTATHLNVFGQTRLGNPYWIFHTHKLTLNLMMLVWW